MNMNMRIIMTMNIYISDKNQELLRQEDSMSGLINRLLEKHYSGLSSNGRIDGFEPSNLGSNPSEPAKTTAPVEKPKIYELDALVPACCTSKKKQCKHWQWDDVQQLLVNSNTGEVVDASI